MLKNIYLLSSSSILSDTVAEIFDVASNTRLLKTSQYYRLTEALNAFLELRDREAIERLFWSVQTGRIQLVDDRSDHAIA